MPDSVSNSIYAISALLLLKTLLSRAKWRQFEAALDPRFLDATRQYARLRKTNPDDAARHMREFAERLRDKQQLEDVLTMRPHGSFLALAAFVVDLLMLGIIAGQFPAAAVPALLASAVAGFKFRSRDQSFDDPNSRLQTGIRLWTSALSNGQQLVAGMTGGALGYALLAAFGIGVPAPGAPLRWRIIGGLIFGAGIGVFASIILWAATASYREMRLVQRNVSRE